MHLKTLIFVFGFVVGIFLGDGFQIATEVAIFSLLVVVAQAGVVFFFRKKENDTRLPIFTILFFIGIFFGIVRIQLVTPSQVFLCDKKCEVYGEVISSPTKKENYQELKISAPGGNENKNYLDVLVKTSLYPMYHAGDRLKLFGEVKTPQVILPTEPNKKFFDYANYLQAQNIGSEMYFPKIEIENGASEKFIYKLINLKISWENVINNFVSAEVSPLANGMLFGDASFTKEMKDNFRISGLSHIVVLSGFNIAILVSFVMFLISFVPIILRTLLAFIFVILFVIMVGAEASVIRATVMASIALFALVSGREYVARQALIISLFLMSVYDPVSLINSVSFHLSFLATAGIIYFSPVLTKIFERFNLKKIFKSIFVTTLSAIIATLPYITYTFGYVSFYALITNMIVLPFVPFAMLLSAITIVSSHISEWLAYLFGFVDILILEFITDVAKFFSWLPFSYVSISISLVTMFVLYVSIIVLYFVLKNFSEKEKRFDETTLEEFEVFKY